MSAIFSMLSLSTVLQAAIFHKMVMMPLLFEQGVVIQTFGDVDLDGTGEAWEYTDSWAYMVGDTWTYGGVNCTDGSQTFLIVLIQFVRKRQLIFMVVWIPQHVIVMGIA